MFQELAYFAVLPWLRLPERASEEVEEGAGFALRWATGESGELLEVDEAVPVAIRGGKGQLDMLGQCLRTGLRVRAG